MKNQMKFVSVLLCLCMCLCCVRCNTKPKAEISFLSMEEAGVTDPTPYLESWVYTVRQEGEEIQLLKAREEDNSVFSIIVATVLEHETKTALKTYSPSLPPEPVSYVTNIAEINDVLLGNYEIGSKIYFAQGAIEIDNVYYPYRTTQLSGGFMRTGTQVLLFLKESTGFAKEIYGKNFQFPVLSPINCGFSNRVVREDGTLGFLEKNRHADVAAFRQYNTVEEVRAALPQIFETYRDTYKTDYSLIDTYRASPGAAPAAPENYVHYYDLP